MRRLGRMAIVAAGLLAAGTAWGQSAHWAQVAEAVVGHLDSAVTAYKGGDADQAKRAVIDAYFGTFEDRKMEAAMRKDLGGKHTAEVEQRFGSLRKIIGRNAPPDELAGVVATLKDALRADARTLDEHGISPDVYQVK